MPAPEQEPSQSPPRAIHGFGAPTGDAFPRGEIVLRATGRLLSGGGSGRSADVGRDLFGAVGLLGADGIRRWIAHFDPWLRAIAPDRVPDEGPQCLVALDVTEH